MITKEAVLAALSHVQEPDLGKDLVTLNMIQDVQVAEGAVSFTVELTTPACPLKDLIERACINAIKHFIGPEIAVKVTLTARTTTARKDSGAVMAGVKNIIAVMSGKGGVGKSTVAVNLALGLQQGGATVGLLDADIHGPSLPLMLGARDAKPMMREVDGKGKIVPIERFGLKAMSIGLLVEEGQAVIWRGPQASAALKQFINDVDWGELDYLVIDMPPGTGDVHLTLVQTVPVTGAVIVSTPQPVAVADARKAIAMLRTPQIGVPVLGVVENMAYFTPAELPDARYYIFGKGGAEAMAQEYDVPFLGAVPIVQSIREGGDEGVPAMMGDESVSRAAFVEVAANVARAVSIRNATGSPTRVVQMAS